MTALAASALEYDLIFEKLALYRLQPAEKLLSVFFVLLSKVRPLPAEIFRGLGLVGLDLFKIGKPRHTANDAILASAFRTREHALDDLFVFILAGVDERDITAAGGACKQIEQSFFH